MEKLILILRRSLNAELETGWLYAEKKFGAFTKDSNAKILDRDTLGEDEMSDEMPRFAVDHQLIETIDSATTDDVCKAALSLEAPLSDETLLEAFNYYVKYDAFLPQKGFIPLPREDHIRKLDLDFYESLGVESAELKCRKADCARGVVRFSVFCRAHHFEMIKKRVCPFCH